MLLLTALLLAPPTPSPSSGMSPAEIFMTICRTVQSAEECRTLYYNLVGQDIPSGRPAGGGSYKPGGNKPSPLPDWMAESTIIHPYPDACALEPRPEFVWLATKEAKCSTALLMGPNNQQIELACPASETPGQALRARPPQDLAPGHWRLQVYLSDGRRMAPADFEVGPLGPRDAAPCDPANDGPPPTCSKDLQGEDARACEAMILLEQRRWWEVEALLQSPEAGAQSAELLRSLRALKGRPTETPAL
ncbi:MAG: hypothetical protein H6740_02855 [Alphaproteobacteria bacterium]|nr:hypothetical protein [Alphaproteobacteria bacterium]